MTNQIFIPTVAKFKEDIETSLGVQEPLVTAGYKPGLMLVILGGLKGITTDAEKQYANLRDIKPRYPQDSQIVTMLSNMPIEEIDFLHNADYATGHVRQGIDFARGLPIGGRRILTFHLNTLVSKEEFLAESAQNWRNVFHRDIEPRLREIGLHARNQGIEVKVETVPVPEFGDIPSSDERIYRGVKLHQLRNPFYLTARWGFDELYDTGLGVCLDVCHTRTIYKVAESSVTKGILHDFNISELDGCVLFDDLRHLRSSDLIHLNDGDGIYSETNDTLFREGVPLGQGDIRDLRDIIKYINTNKIPFVLEVNEQDFKKRPNTKDSIDYLLRL